MDEDDKAFLEKKKAGMSCCESSTPPTKTNCLEFPLGAAANIALTADEKARKEMAAKAGGKGPLNSGGQGIKKSGKK